MRHYAHYNSSYKKLLKLARNLNAPEPIEIFKIAGHEPSNSQLQSWRVGTESKHFRPISEDMLHAFIDGLIEWSESKLNHDQIGD